MSVSGYSAVVCHEDAYVITQVANTADVYSCMADDFTCAAGDALARRASSIAARPASFSSLSSFLNVGP